MSEFYVIATPIGNLQDISIRALETLKICDAIICEDTRITARLLERYDIKNKKLLTYNDNSDESIRKKIAKLMLTGSNIALVSDAGTPLISDPGHKLIGFLRENNVKIIPIPGASSLTAALSVSGIACDNFLFIGFLPAAKIQRQNYLKTLPKNYTIIFFEAANRVSEVLADLQENFGNRKIAIAREITKIHEEIINDTISNISEFFTKNQEKLKGEFVLVLEKAAKDEKSISQYNLELEIKKLADANISLKEISQQLADIYGLHKKEIYQLALKILKS